MKKNIYDVGAAYTAARQYFTAGKLQEAARICKEILASQPRQFDAMHMLGGVALQMGNPFQAAKLIRDSIDLRPGEAVAYMNLGRALYQLGKLEDALAAYRKAIKIQNDLSEARQQMRETKAELKSLGERVRAIESLAQAPVIKFTQEEREMRRPHPATINLAIGLYKHFGYLIFEDIFSEQYINELYTYFEGEYSRYFVDKCFDDALIVGDKRKMVTVSLQGPFNDPGYYANPMIMPILMRLLGGDLILFSLGAVVSLPGAKLQRTHRDHLSLFEGENMDDILPSFAVTLGIPLIEMNDVNGTTRMYGKTHRTQGELSDKDKERSISPVVGRGSCMLFDYRVFHEGTPNNSDNVRPLMYNIYTRPWFRDCQNYSKQVPLSITGAEYSKVPEKYRRLLSWAHTI